MIFGLFLFPPRGTTPSHNNMNKFKLAFHPNIDSQFSVFHEVTFKTEAEAKAALKTIADYTLFLHESGLMPDHSNAAYLGELIDGKWQDLD